jgi:hypothetical protein
MGGTFFRFAAVVAVTSVTAFVSGCAAEDVEDPAAGSGEGESALSEKYDVNELMQDSEMRGGTKLSVARIQAFLESKGSYLASYEEEGQSAAQIIADNCKRANISPIYMLARIQTESSLVSSGTSRSLKAATGCACPDHAACDRSNAGFKQQVECAADLHASYFEEMRDNGVTRADWGVGKRMRTLDPCSVTPRTMATAVLYTYTPWVGTRGKQCSSRGSSGSTTLVSIVKSYAGELSSP